MASSDEWYVKAAQRVDFVRVASLKESASSCAKEDKKATWKNAGSGSVESKAECKTSEGVVAVDAAASGVLVAVDKLEEHEDHEEPPIKKAKPKGKAKPKATPLTPSLSFGGDCLSTLKRWVGVCISLPEQTWLDGISRLACAILSRIRQTGNRPLATSTASLRPLLERLAFVTCWRNFQRDLKKCMGNRWSRAASCSWAQNWSVVLCQCWTSRCDYRTRHMFSARSLSCCMTDIETHNAR